MAFGVIFVGFISLEMLSSFYVLKVEAGDICDGYPVNETIGGNFTKTDLHSHLFKCSGYTREVWDHELDDEKVSVITAVKKLVEVNSAKEEITLKLGVAIVWNDKRLKWNTTWYSGATYITKDLEDVWVPPIALSLAQYTQFERLRVEIEHTGIHWFFLEFNLNVPCDFTLRLFPFDRQSCWLNFTDHTHFEHKIQYMCSEMTQLAEGYFSPNSEWDVEKTVCGEIQLKGVKSKIYLARKPEFYVLNVLIPVICLGVMNVLVFLLPVEYDGRVGMCVTVFLAWTVFITFIIHIVPNGSDEIPWLSYVLVAQSIISLVSLFVNVLMVRLNYVKNDWLMGYFRCSCRPCRCSSCRPCRRSSCRCPCKKRNHPKKLESDNEEAEAETEMTAEERTSDETPLDNMTGESTFVSPFGRHDNNDPEGCTFIIFKKRINNGCLVLCFLVTLALYIAYFVVVLV